MQWTIVAPVAPFPIRMPGGDATTATGILPDPLCRMETYAHTSKQPLTDNLLHAVARFLGTGSTGVELVLQRGRLTADVPQRATIDIAFASDTGGVSHTILEASVASTVFIGTDGELRVSHGGRQLSRRFAPTTTGPVTVRMTECAVLLVGRDAKRRRCE